MRALLASMHLFVSPRCGQKVRQAPGPVPEGGTRRWTLFGSSLIIRAVSIGACVRPGWNRARSGGPWGCRQGETSKNRGDTLCRVVRAGSARARRVAARARQAKTLALAGSPTFTRFSLRLLFRGHSLGCAKERSHRLSKTLECFRAFVGLGLFHYVTLSLRPPSKEL